MPSFETARNQTWRKLRAWLGRLSCSAAPPADNPNVNKDNSSYPTLDTAKPLTEVLAYHHSDIILQELATAQAWVNGILGTHPHMYLFGSAARNELRTTDEDPEDPSDIDVLAIISDDDSRHIRQLQHQHVPFSESSTDEYRPGDYRYSIKLPSVSNLLSPTEVFFCTPAVLSADMRSVHHPDRAAFICSAVTDAIEVPDQALDA